MIAEIAPALLCLAVFAAALLAVCGFRGASPRHAVDMRLLKRLALLCLLLTGGAFAILMHGYAVSDFSIANVYENSHTLKPMLFKLTGTWGNHEGSMLLWVTILVGFTAAYALRISRSDAEKAGGLAVLGAVIAGFLLFVLLTSNPFMRMEPVPLQGHDLNPLLQDIGLAIHPPLLYLGYVGFAVVFALAVGALAADKPIDSEWAKEVRPWALLAWSFLTAGIGLGSWWAYRELGWGGWWFWDPVENVSLLPWLSGTALIHCLLILAKRPMLQNWTLLLAIFTFTFSLLGTFLVRSGLLTSVHSFASDPSRGIYILLFITSIIGGSLWLYALRYPRPAEPDFLPVSREGGIMVNNLLLVTLCATVFLGIIYPLLMQVFALPSVSVGAPFYNTVVIPIAVPLLLVAGIAPLLAWKQAGWKASRKLLRHAAIAGGCVLALSALLFHKTLPALLAMPLACATALMGVWLLGASAVYARRQYQAHNAHLPLHACGMALAHAGLAVFVIAASFATAGRVETEQRLSPGDHATIPGYSVELAELVAKPQDNYLRKRATVHLTADDNSASYTLHPETRFYESRGMETAESSIHGDMRQDIYTAIATAAILGDSSNSNHSVILRIYIIPAMWWLWTGFVLTVCGGFVAAFGYFRRT